MTMTLRQYAQQEGITIETAYRRVWNGRVQAERVDGRWQIVTKREKDKRTSLHQSSSLATSRTTGSVISQAEAPR